MNKVIPGIVGLMLLVQSTQGADWKPADNPLMTRWAKQVGPENALSEYPRPQMVRSEWQNLNGLWDFAVSKTDSPGSYTNKILVPFPVESALSGLRRTIEADDRMWYRRTFNIPSKWREGRVLLHFDAVDWETVVYVNGKEVGNHKGGYDAFTCDITKVLVKKDQELVVLVRDPQNTGGQPKGKQVHPPGRPPSGIMYTRSSGIWQTVWLESVPRKYITGYKLFPDIDKGELRVTVDVEGGKASIEAIAYDGADQIAAAKGKAGETLVLPIKNAKLWSPGSPFLYDLKIEMKAGRTKDSVKSYFGMRKTSVGKDEYGITRLLLNNKFVFQLGPLDQGFWPDGLYTAPVDDALLYDVEMTKKYGFNMIRKHVKIEPSRWYYWCDKVGLLVWQDMPSSGNKTPQHKKQFETELVRMVEGFFNHPSIVVWVPFNEGWGQYDTERIVDIVKATDPTRLVDNASGWTDKKCGDILDIHSYSRGPRSPQPEDRRAVVLGEFGGLGYNTPGHCWNKSGWGYQRMNSTEELIERYEALYELIAKLIVSPGLSAAVYTQTTDIEAENNGLMTYDREVSKMPIETVARAHKGPFPPTKLGGQDIFVDSMDVTLVAPYGAKEIRYTLNGAEPNRRSAKYNKPIHITRNTTLKAYTLYDDGSPSNIREYQLKKLKPMPPVAAEHVKPGLAVKVYEGSWSKLPDFARLKPIATKVAENIDISNKPHNDNYGLLFEGFIKIEKSGAHMFYTASDDGSALYIDGKQVVDNDGVHGVKERSGAVALEAGMHAIKILFFQRDGGHSLTVSYSYPHKPKQELPADVLYHVE